jgi:hypothetical protein
MASFGFYELFVIALAVSLPCLGMLIVGTILVVIARLTQNSRQDQD